MTNLPPEPKPDDQQPPDDEGRMGFLLGPREHPDGTPIEWTAEDIRRFKALMHHAQRIAKHHGLKLDDLIEADSANVAESERSKEIKQASNPTMSDAAVRIIADRQSINIEQPDGTKVQATRTRLELDAMLGFEKSIKALASLIAKPFNWSGRLFIRCGKWMKVIASVSNEEGERKG